MSRGLQLWLCSLSCGAFAQAPPARDIALEVSAPPDAACPSAAELESTVEERVGSIVFLSAENVERSILVEIERDATGPGFSANLTLTDAAGHSLGARTVQTSEGACRALEPAIVLVISTLVGIARESAPVEPAPEPPPVPEPERPANEATEATPPPRFVGERTLSAESGPSLSIGIAAQGALGLLPSIGALAALELWTRFGALGLRLGAGVAPHAERDLGQGAQASFRALHGSLQLCLTATDRGPGPLSFCAGARAGALAAMTSGLSETRSNTEPYVLLSAGPALCVTLAREHALLLGLSGFFPVIAPRYYYIERDESRRYYHAVELGLLVEIGWLMHLGS